MQADSITSEPGKWKSADDIFKQLKQNIEQADAHNKAFEKEIAFYKDILMQAPVLFFVANIVEHTIIWSNNAFKRFIGETPISHEKIINKIKKLYNLPDCGKDEIRQKIDEVEYSLLRIKDKNDQLKSYYLKSHPIRLDNQNNPVEYMILGFDFSEQMDFISKLEDLVDENKRLKNSILTKTLSKREKEVVRLIAEGFSSRKIAQKLQLSFYTVETHRKNILRKTELKNTAELIRFAAESGLI